MTYFCCTSEITYKVNPSSPHPGKLAELYIVNIIAFFIHTNFNKYCFFCVKFHSCSICCFFLLLLLLFFVFISSTLLYFTNSLMRFIRRAHTQAQTEFTPRASVFIIHRGLTGWRMMIGRCHRLTNLCCYRRIIGFGFQLYSSFIALGNYLSNRLIRKIASNSMRKEEKNSNLEPWEFDSRLYAVWV